MYRRTTGMHKLLTSSGDSGHPGGNGKICQDVLEDKEYAICSDPDDLYIRTRPLAEFPYWDSVACLHSKQETSMHTME